MTVLESKIDARAPSFARNTDTMKRLLEELRKLAGLPPLLRV